MLGKIEGGRRRGCQARWHHRCNGHKLGQTSGGVKDRRLVKKSMARRELDTTGQLNNKLHVLKISRYRNDYFFNLNKATDEIIFDVSYSHK